MSPALDRSSPVPCHVQIVQQLRREILSLPAGHAVPSERALAERFGVSRMTAREAVRILRQEGLVFVARGRGLFAAERKLDLHEQYRLMGFSADMRQRGLSPSSRLLRFDRVPARGQIAADLRVKAGEPLFRLERLRFADRTPMAFECTYLPVAICPGLYRFDLSREALYRLLRDEFNLRLARGAEELEAIAAGRSIARLFKVNAADPVLAIQRVVYDARGRPVETTRAIYRGDRYRTSFQITATP